MVPKMLSFVVGRQVEYQLTGQFLYIKILTWLRGLGDYTKEMNYSSLDLNVISFKLVLFPKSRSQVEHFNILKNCLFPNPLNHIGFVVTENINQFNAISFMLAVVRVTRLLGK